MYKQRKNRKATMMKYFKESEQRLGGWQAIDKHGVCGYLKCNNHDNKLEFIVTPPRLRHIEIEGSRGKELLLVKCAASCFSLDYGNLIL